MNTLSTLNNDRQRTFHEMRSIQDKAAAGNREMTSAEEAAWQSCNRTLDTLDARIGRIVDIETRSAAAEKAMAVYGPEPSANDAQIREVISGERRHLDVPIEQRDVVQTGTGANVVPTGFSSQLVEAMLEAAVVPGLSTAFVTSSVGELKVPAATVHPSVSAITVEAAAISETDPTFAQISFDAYKYATLTQVSRETIEDSGVDLVGYLAARCGEAVGRQFGADCVTGDGSSNPDGIVTASTAGVTAAAVAAITMDELVDLFHSVTSPYRSRPGCGWLLNDGTAAALRKLKDTDGRYLWEPSSQAGEPDLLLGKPVHIDPNVSALATGNKTVLFGDLASYGVRYAGQVRFERSDDFAFSTDLVTFRCVLRADGQMLDTTGAVKHLIQA